MNNPKYDVLILGGGPSGYTAALYCARAGLETLVIEKFSAGGQMTMTSQIDNYPGFDEGVDGFTLGFKMQSGAERFGAKTVRAEILKVALDEKLKMVETSEGIFCADAVIIATGAKHKSLGLESEERLIGKGVGYCGVCDGMFYRGKTVAVIGGGNSAAIDSLHLSNICNKVFLVHRRSSLRAEKYYQDALSKAENIEFLWDSVLVEILSEEKVSGIRVENTKNGERIDFPVDGVFISIGRAPETELFRGQLSLDSYGYIIADETTKTNIDGVFAIGDVRTKPVRQIVTATSDGAVASHFVEEYLAKKN